MDDAELGTLTRQGDRWMLTFTRDHRPASRLRPHRDERVAGQVPDHHLDLLPGGSNPAARVTTGRARAAVK